MKNTPPKNHRQHRNLNNMLSRCVRGRFFFVSRWGDAPHRAPIAEATENICGRGAFANFPEIPGAVRKWLRAVWRFVALPPDSCIPVLSRFIAGRDSTKRKASRLTTSRPGVGPAGECSSTRAILDG